MDRVFTGQPELDRLLCAVLAPGGCCVIAGRPGMGRTEVSMLVAATMARASQPVLYLSAIRSAYDLERQLSSFIPAAALPIWFGNAPAASMEELQSLVASWCDDVARGRPGVLVIDYLQIFFEDRARPRDALPRTLGSLKELARQRQLAVIVISQLPRPGEASDGRPQPADLLSLVEAGADVACGVYREKTRAIEVVATTPLRSLVGPVRVNMAAAIEPLAQEGSLTDFGGGGAAEASPAAPGSSKAIGSDQERS